jgi:hypothetical protein
VASAIRLAAALLRPGDQQGPKARQTLIGQGTKALFRAIKAPGLRILPGKIHGREGFIRNDPREPGSVRTAIQQGCDKGALHDLGLIRVAPERRIRLSAAYFVSASLVAKRPAR